jgi:4-hydroxythreonine-4-phosphate dehydrogenase
MAIKAPSKGPIKILITSGDPDGVGWEVTAKALNRLGPQSGVQFICFRSSVRSRSEIKIRPPFTSPTVGSLNEALSRKFDTKTVVVIESTQPAALWVEQSAKACLNGLAHAMVTAPLSKTSILAAGLNDIGHTEILSRLSGVNDLFMGFLGSKFNVLLATGHSPLKEAVTEFDIERLRKAVAAAKRMRSLLASTRARKPMALVGLNPHAGEEGIIGREEQWMRSLAGKDLQGPLVPDAAFLAANWKRYSVYICPYHDQGLIPFKMVHGFGGGVHLTLGLPFVRTSVDHGTAKELFGKNRANPGSMQDALKMALRLAKEKSR